MFGLCFLVVGVFFLVVVVFCFWFFCLVFLFVGVVSVVFVLLFVFCCFLLCCGCVGIGSWVLSFGCVLFVGVCGVCVALLGSAAVPGASWCFLSVQGANA